MKLVRLRAPGGQPVVDSSFPLRDIAAAFRHYEAQKHFGKICLEV
ncbi:zinc-binding dehydrogenase [Mesorhizobium sp. PL10]